MYHRVTNAVSDPQLLCVTPRHFAEQLAVLSERYRILPLREFVARAEAGASLRGTAAITFDDGYADNLHEARPLLERFAAPATVFVATGYIGTRKEFWWDELERLLLQPGELPRSLAVEAGARIYAWNLGQDASYSAESCNRHLGWNVAQPTNPTRRHALYRDLHMLLSLQRTAQREQLLQAVRDWSGHGCEGRASHRALTEDETRTLAHGSLIELGAHTKTHPVLSMLPAHEQRAEIAASRDKLQTLTGRAIKTFAYPYGGLADYKRNTVKVVADLGFDAACSTFSNVITGPCDRLQLPRFTVRDWDGETMRARLQQWAGA